MCSNEFIRYPFGKQKTSPVHMQHGLASCHNLSLTVLHEERANVASPRYAGDAANGSGPQPQQTWSTLCVLYITNARVCQISG